MGWPCRVGLALDELEKGGGKWEAVPHGGENWGKRAVWSQPRISFAGPRSVCGRSAAAAAVPHVLFGRRIDDCLSRPQRLARVLLPCEPVDIYPCPTGCPQADKLTPWRPQCFPPPPVPRRSQALPVAWPMIQRGLGTCLYDACSRLAPLARGPDTSQLVSLGQRPAVPLGVIVGRCEYQGRTGRHARSGLDHSAPEMKGNGANQGCNAAALLQLPGKTNIHPIQTRRDRRYRPSAPTMSDSRLCGRWQNDRLRISSGHPRLPEHRWWAPPTRRVLHPVCRLRTPVHPDGHRQT